MKLAMRDYTDVSSGAADEMAVTFEANAVAFYAQMSGLAKDKISYPIREICTNAWDAGRGEFEVYLPTQLNPTFRVRDYGPGMSPELMRDVYARMYASTKRDSNTSVGGWGLGRFSPFAYLISDSGAGSYTIVSYQGGVARTYVMSINQAGAPVLRLLAEVPTELRDGMEVSFAVQRNDIHSFTYRARRILWSFEPRPRVFPEVDFGTPEVVQAGEGWTLFKSNSVAFDAPHVRMGCVMYPFDIEALDISSDLISHNDPILFEAPIGSLRVTLSREAIAYDEMTTSTLKAAVKRFETELMTGIQAKIDAAGNYFEARKILEDETNAMRGGRSKYVRERVRWSGLELADSLKSADAKFMVLAEGWNGFTRFEGSNPSTAGLTDTRIVVEHNPNRSLERFTKANMVGTRILWVRVKKPKLAAVMAAIGNPAYEVLDTMAVEPRIAPSKTTFRKRKVMNTGAYVDKISVESIDLAAGGLKMLRVGRDKWSGFNPKFGTSWSKSSFESFLAFCKRQGWIAAGQPILVDSYDTPPVGENWRFIGDVMIEKLEALSTVSPPSNLRKMSSRDIPVRLEQVRDLMNFMENGPADLAALGEKVKRATSLIGGSATENDSDRARSWLEQLGTQVARDTTASPLPPLENEWRELSHKYPMLELIFGISVYDAASRRRRLDLATHYFDLMRKPNAPIDPE